MAVEIERGTDGRWVARIPEVPGIVAYGATADDARRAALVLALRVVADRIEQGQSVSDALLAAFAALEAALEPGGGRATRVLSTVLRIGAQIRQQSGPLRALTSKSGPGKR